MADATYNSNVYLEQGGDALVLKPGGKIKVGGSIVLTTDAAGNLLITGLPTANPAVAGALYANSGVVTVSAGA